MKNTNPKIVPTGLKGNQINERMKELMGIAPINENKRTSVVELTKLGPDGNVYAIVRENHEYYIKIASKRENLIAEDFKYIGGLQNKKSEAYPSYAKAIKHLNLKFNSLNEALDIDVKINVFENDNLVKESGIAGFSEMTGSGFSGEGNLDGNKTLNSHSKLEEDQEPELDSLNTKNPVEEELSEVEKAVDDMMIHEVEETEEEKKNNPWSICTASVGREDKAKYERCVKDVKKEKGISESVTLNEWPEHLKKGRFTAYCKKNGFEGPSIECSKKAMKSDDSSVRGMATFYMNTDKPKGETTSDITENKKLSIVRALEQMDSIIDTLAEGKTVKKKSTR